MAGLEPAGDRLRCPSFGAAITDEVPQPAIPFEDGVTPSAPLIGSGGVERRRAAPGQGVSAQLPRHGGWEHADAVLPSVVGQMVAARGSEETTAWRHPVDLVALCEGTAAELPELFRAAPASDGWSDHAQLSAALLGDDANAILAALKAAVRAGASPADLGRSLAYAAALRVARFGTANEHADWETALHVFTYANAIHQALKRIGTEDNEGTGGIEAVRGVLHGAIALYLARYLNVPPARLPGEGSDQLDDLPSDVEG